MSEKTQDTQVNQGRQMNGSPTFYSLLQEMAQTHDRKSHDYASNDNPYGNYTFAGELASLFSHSKLDVGFVSRVGEKLYRLANLERSQKAVYNESIEDTEKDIATIVTLWMAARRDIRQKNQVYDNEKAVAGEYHNANEEAVSIILEQFPKLTHLGLRGVTDFFRRALADMEAKGIAQNLKAPR